MPEMDRTVLEVERRQVREDAADFRVGDTVNVYVRVVEGDKERTQVFNGTVIGRRGAGTREMFTVRRIVQGEGVERTFPLQSPKVLRVEVVKRPARVRRAKLHYLRQRVGKQTRLREKQAGKSE
jgi:large subunit ribosomal protein L19